MQQNIASKGGVGGLNDFKLASFFPYCHAVESTANSVAMMCFGFLECFRVFSPVMNQHQDSCELCATKTYTPDKLADFTWTFWGFLPPPPPPSILNVNHSGP